MAEYRHHSKDAYQILTLTRNDLWISTFELGFDGDCKCSLYESFIKPEQGEPILAIDPSNSRESLECAASVVIMEDTYVCNFFLSAFVLTLAFGGLDSSWPVEAVLWKDNGDVEFVATRSCRIGSSKY